jgi:hypothetical protein
MLSQEEAENKILSHASVEISPQAQQSLNKPLGHPGGLSEKDTAFMTMLVDMVDKKKIDLYKPGTLLNTAVYDQLNEGAKAKAELDAFNMMATIREINKLWKAGMRNTYQIENLVHKMRLTKERLEEAGGDIFII